MISYQDQLDYESDMCVELREGLIAASMRFQELFKTFSEYDEKEAESILIHTLKNCFLKTEKTEKETESNSSKQNCQCKGALGPDHAAFGSVHDACRPF